MRCSSCEPQLDAYVEAMLDPARAHALAAHLQSCARCEEIHRRLRAVDGLLLTARVADLRDDFTARVMAEVRCLPSPLPANKPLLPLAAFYLVAAWIAAIAAAIVTHPRLPIGTGAIAGAGGIVRAVEQGMQAVWPIAPVALPVVVAVLAVDALLFAAVVFFYRRIRPRLNAYLAAPVEVS